ncbi:MAG: mechanosensitive ion channel family protein [Candidatus Omnitrophica bacterium]|nr:mechanosensitive ion channel family protein [Candidatus Omnitrophota bacterium]
MGDSITIFGIKIFAWIYIPLSYLLWVMAGLLIKGIVFKSIKKFAKKTKTKADDILVDSLDVPLLLLIFTSGGILVERIAPITAGADLAKYVVLGFKAVTIIAIVLFFDKFINKLIEAYSPKYDVLQTSGSVVKTITRLLVIGIGLLVLLDSFGVSITPVLASLGIGSLAVALALQPTLENFFSGVQIIVDKPIKVGQFVKLESGEEGYVHKIGWRSTWIRMLPNNIVVMPNKVMVNSRVTNYYYPEQELAVLVQVGVHYTSDLEKVEKVTIEVGREVMKEVVGGIKDFEPFIRYHTFDHSSINFSVILRAKEFVDNYLIKHEFIKRLAKRYTKEGIVIPFPIRAINYDQEKSLENIQKS